MLVPDKELLACDSDEPLLARIAAGDSVAFETFFDRHCGAAFGLAYRILHASQPAEDVVQDAFMTVWRRPSAYAQERGSVRAWLLAIVHHRSIDLVRSAALRERTQGDPGWAAIALTDGSDTWAQACRSIEGARVQHALAHLPAEQRQAITLAYFSGLTHAEIARHLKLPLGTVKGRVRIGLKKLGTYLGDLAVEATEPEGALQSMRPRHYSASAPPNG